MTFEEWLIKQYALHTSYSEAMQPGQQSDIKEYMTAAWEAGYEQGYEQGHEDGCKQSYDQGYEQGYENGREEAM